MLPRWILSLTVSAFEPGADSIYAAIRSTLHHMERATVIAAFPTS